MNLTSIYATLNKLLAAIARLVQPVLLLVLRLWWGWSFFRTGLGKLMHLDGTAGYFASLHIPFPHLNATMAGSVECVGGLLLLVGLWARIAAVPLMFTLLVAYATAERDALFSIFSDPDKFTGATPFLFLLAVLTVFTFGPGKISVDELVWARRRRGTVLERSDRREHVAASSDALAVNRR